MLQTFLPSMDQLEKSPQEKPAEEKPAPKKEKEDITGGWSQTTLLNSYLSGVIKHEVYKPRGKPSDVWQRGLYALYKLDGSIIPDWYICKHNDCNQLFNLKLSKGNSRLRDHLAQHDKEAGKVEVFSLSYDQMVSVLQRSNIVGDAYGIVRFGEILPRPEAIKNWLVFFSNY